MVVDIDSLLDFLLPADKRLHMPSLIEIGFLNSYHYVNNKCAFDNLLEFFSELCLKDENRFIFYDELNEQYIGYMKRKYFREFSAVVVSIFEFYYTNKNVLQNINAGSCPPFPEGNSLGADDWSILEPVYERGMFIRGDNDEY